jgi:plasmid rolling circle replication initiator protein Rep
MGFHRRRREASPLLDISQISEQLSKLEYVKKERTYSFKKQAERLKSCNKTKDLFLGEEGFVEIGKKCNYRICPYCSKNRAWRAYTQFIDFLKTKRIARSIYDNGLRHLILTIKNQKDMAEGIDKLYNYFRKFRRSKYANEKIKGEKRLRGGLGIIQITRGKDGLYHVHLHFIIDSAFLDMKSHKKKGGDPKLVREWKRCTGGDGILQVKRVRGYEGALNYVLRYIAGEFEGLSSEDVALFYKATFGRRLLFTFGSFYKIKRPKKTKKFQYILPYSEEYAAYYNSKTRKHSKNILEDYRG